MVSNDEKRPKDINNYFRYYKKMYLLMKHS